MSLKTVNRYGRLNVASEYACLDPETVKKIQACFDINEPFGLQCSVSCYIFVPETLTVAFYHTDNTRSFQTFPNLDKMTLALSMILFSHDQFVGPLGVAKFLRAIKVIDALTPKIITDGL